MQLNSRFGAILIPTYVHKEDDDIHVEGNLYCGDDSSPNDEVTLIPEGLVETLQVKQTTKLISDDGNRYDT